jgi:hypothetical protein
MTARKRFGMLLFCLGVVTILSLYGIIIAGIR